jgi:murein DD-endopeptidase MepM/ murein hydrolase activator NlpD
MRGKADAANRPRGLPEKTRPNNLGGDKFRFEKDSKTYAKEAVKHEGGRNAAGSAARSVGNIRTNVRADAVNMGENVGVQTARGAFNQTTRATGFVAEKSVNAAKFIHSRPERLAAKAQKKAVAAKTKSVRKSANLEYKKIRAANPQTGNPISRMIQKNKIKTAYAKAAGIKLRNPAVNVAKTGAKILTSPLRAIGNKIYGATIGRAVNAVKTAVTIIKLTPAVLLTIIVVSLLLLPFGGGGGASVAASYLSTPETVNETDLIYTGWEADLLLEIANAAQANPGYDEYRYNIGVVEHSPYELLSYLSAMYGGFTLDATMINILRSIFDMQYTLSYVPETETRWREVTETDLVTGAESTEYEPYDWHVLNVVLASRPLSGVLPAMPTTEQQEIYDVYMMTKGGLQSAASPFDFNWLYMVTCEYGYHADTSSGIKYIYEGVDIAAPADTEVRAGYDGTVVETGSDHIVIESEDGVRAKYAHVASVYAVVGQTVKTGDTIAKTGADDMYFELSQGGMCYNPLFFAETNDDGTGAPGGVYSGGMTMDDLSGIVWVSGTRAGNQAVIDLALTQVGNAGGRPYWSYVGFSSRVAWCGIFAHWSYHVAGYGSGYAQSGNNFYAPTLDAWFKGAGTFRQPGYTDTAPGDVIFFDWEGDGRPNHVGLVIGRDANRVYTVEGNSRDSVRIKSYPLDSAAIYGYGLLNG